MQGRAQLRSVARRASAQERSSTTFRRRRPCSSRYSSSPHTRLASSSTSVRTAQIPWGVIWEYVDHELSSLEDPRAAGFIAAVGGPVPNDDVVAILREVDQRTREGLTGWVSKAQQ